ncbi:MAG: uracil-DNA glycosylase [Fuerstiella sp.]
MSSENTRRGRPRSKTQSRRQWDKLNYSITVCERCPRLITHCRKVAAEKRAAYRNEDYWGRPVPNFGDPAARLLIVGLAPAAHGANRTGRMFTGDRSGDWLYRSLYTTGFASQPVATSQDDGLTLIGCAITAPCHCAPPANRPTPEELSNCAPWLAECLRILPVRVLVALGGIAWTAVWKHFRQTAADDLLPQRTPKFGHRAEVQLTNQLTLLGSYHPSQQNTFTGRLTRPMLNSVFRRAAGILGG